jgi:hypothetical protein
MPRQKIKCQIQSLSSIIKIKVKKIRVGSHKKIVRSPSFVPAGDITFILPRFLFSDLLGKYAVVHTDSSNNMETDSKHPNILCCAYTLSSSAQQER